MCIRDSLEPINSGYNLAAINDNFQVIEAGWDEKLDRIVNAQPNQMEQELDMNNNAIINVEDATEDWEVVNLRTMRAYVLDNTDGENYALRAEAAAEAAEDSQEEVQELTDQWREDYLGNGSTFPSPEDRVIAEGALFYYDGTLYTQGLYIYYSYQQEDNTGPWKLVSGPGPQGPEGAEGIQGAPGEKGDQGLQGTQGDQGQQGIQGAIGDTGPAGPEGQTGATGPQGVQGVKGDKGDQGQRGLEGPIGPQGVTGPQGPIGPKGDMGDDGDSFNIDEFGPLADRVLYDNEARGFTYYATDFQVREDEQPRFNRFIGNGTRTDFTLDFAPDGQQSLVVLVGGIQQGPDLSLIHI